MTDRKHWLPSVSTCFDAPGEALYRALAEEGIFHVELSGRDLPFWQTQSLSSRVREMRQFGIEPSSIHLPFEPFDRIDPTLEDASARDFVVRYQGDLLRNAAQAGVSIAVIHPSAEPIRAFERGERMRRCIDTLARIARVAEDCGVLLAVENLPRTCLGNIHEEIALILREIPSLRACFDTNHSLRQSNADFVAALGAKIVTIHASDYDMIDERHLLPFLGRNDWPAILQALEAADYKGYFTFEVRGKGVLTAHNLRLAYDRLMRLRTV